MEEPEPIIQIEKLSLALAGNAILRGVSLSVNAGEYVSIIGPNGAGKTTLVKCLAGILRGWSGAIRVAGRPFAELSPRGLAKLQSYVPQAEGRTNPLTVEEFVATGRYPHLSAFTSMRAEDYAAVDRELERAGLAELRERKITTLSGGERQMAFIAAALAQDTKIILLDEPSTFLDYRHQANVAAILRSACRDGGVTVVAVHHDVNTAAAHSDRVVAIKNGTIAFEGPPTNALDPQTLRAIYDTEFRCSPSPHSPLPFVTAGGAP